MKYISLWYKYYFIQIKKLVYFCNLIKKDMLFKNVMADPQLKQQLRLLVQENRISHAQLFLSQSGSHSFALAVAYAQYICCHQPGIDDSCGVCPSCVKFEKLSHPDFHLIFPNCIAKKVKKDPDSKQFSQDFKDFVLDKNYHISIDDWLSVLGGENKQATINIRDCSNIINQNSIQSYEGGYKIYLLWCVDRLYHAAAPKLLKTLEEPENKTLFILMTENPDKILATILSRTQLVKIPRLTEEVIHHWLMQDFHISSEKAADIVAICEHDYNKAVELYNGNIELKEMSRQLEVIWESMVALSRNATPDQIKYLDVQQIFADIIAKGREEQKVFIKFMTRIFRNALMCNVNNETMMSATVEEKKLINKYYPFITLRNISTILQECNQSIYHIERNGNSSLIFTDMYLKISQTF